MTKSTIPTQKKEMRRTMRQKRRDLHARTPQVSFSSLAPSFLDAFSSTVVGCYWPMHSELDPLPLMDMLHNRGATLALPVVVAPETALIFRRWFPGQGLEPGPFGTQHPPSESERLKPYVLLVPLLAFDAQGFRLGYGGGFYDRTIAALRAQSPLLTIGLAYAEQEVEHVPTEASDQPLDLLLSQDGLRLWSAAAHTFVNNV